MYKRQTTNMALLTELSPSRSVKIRIRCSARPCTQNECQSHRQPRFGLPWKWAGFTCARAVLASLRNARICGSRIRWSFPRPPRNDHRLPAANPAGLDWPPEKPGNASRTPAPTPTDQSLIQPLHPLAKIKQVFPCTGAGFGIFCCLTVAAGHRKPELR